MKNASWMFGIASALAGILNLVWGEFESAHQPIQAWSDHIPGITFFAVAAALWLIAGGLAVMLPSAARTGAAALAILYAIFCLFPLPRLITAPHFLGNHPRVYVGLFIGIAQQMVLFAAAGCLWLSLTGRTAALSRATVATQWLVGLCCIDFGLGHLTNVQGTAAMIPAWMPLGGPFWTILSGVAFVLGGLGLISGRADVLAARLVALMLLLFSILVLTPRALADPHNHVAWGGDAYNLTAVAAFWILASCFESRRKHAYETHRITTGQTAAA